MMTSSEWQLAVRDGARELLRQARIVQPPVDALALARSLQLTVAIDRTQPGRGRIKRIAGQPTIFLRPESRPERLQWAAAHELGEAQAWKVCRALGLDGAELPPRRREELANHFARELLLPSDWFPRDCTDCEYDLPALKARYRTASHELIAWRWLDLERPGTVTIFDQGVQTQRRTNGPALRPLAPVEQRCWWLLRNTRQPARTQDRHFTVRGWCIDSPDWQREILYAANCCEEDEPYQDAADA